VRARDSADRARRCCSCPAAVMGERRRNSGLLAAGPHTGGGRRVRAGPLVLLRQWITWTGWLGAATGGRDSLLACCCDLDCFHGCSPCCRCAPWPGDGASGCDAAMDGRGCWSGCSHGAAERLECCCHVPSCWREMTVVELGWMVMAGCKEGEEKRGSRGLVGGAQGGGSAAWRDPGEVCAAVRERWIRE